MKNKKIYLLLALILSTTGMANPTGTATNQNAAPVTQMEKEILDEIVNKTSGAAIPSSQVESTGEKKVQKDIQEIKKAEPAERSMVMEYAKMGASLGVVLAVFGFFVWVFKKVSGSVNLSRMRRSERSQLEIISRMSIGPKREILVMRAMDHMMVVSSSESGIQYLTTIDDSWSGSPKAPSMSSHSPSLRSENRGSAPIDELVDRIEMKEESFSSRIRDKLKGLKELS